jgi:hypothetical protein
VAQPEGQIRTSRRFEGADPAELHLANLAETGRRRRGRGRESEGRRGRPKRFLFCFPWIKSRRVRSQILRCFVSGMFLTLLLAVCRWHLALPGYKSRANQAQTWRSRLRRTLTTASLRCCLS